MPCVLFAQALAVAAGAHAAEVVALGASQTYGKGVDRGEDFPAQLEILLRAKGLKVSVTNAGVNGETTDGMWARLDSVLDANTRVLVLQPGGNDRRAGVTGDHIKENIDAIKASVAARRIRVVMVPNTMFHDLPHQSDAQHLTPEGYRRLAEQLEPAVAAALGH